MKRPLRIAVVADGVGALPGVTELLAQLRQRVTCEHEVDDVLAVDPGLAEGRYDVLQVFAPAPAAVSALRTARLAGVPVAACYHRAVSTSARADLLPAFYRQCRVVLSPGAAADASLATLGIAPQRIRRWLPGVDCERFSPARYAPEMLPACAFNVLHVGPPGHGGGFELLVEAFGIAHDRAPRLALVLAGCGEPPPRLRARLGNAVTFLPDCDQLARAYASADLLVVAEAGDWCASAILAAQASGLPVLAVDAGCPAEVIESGRSGCLVPADPQALASAMRWLARRAAVRERLASGGLRAARTHTWERSLAQLADAWACAADRCPSAGEVARAA
jgi:glycosyltransferase involved in cell wall biosynthesis